MTQASSNTAVLNQTQTTDLLASRAKVSSSQGFGIAFWLPAVWIGVLLFSAVFADILPLHDPAASDFANLKARPSLEYWFGTDVVARDIFSRVIYGARISLTVAFFAPVFGMMIGLALGMLAGYYRGAVESMIVGTTDVILAFPNIVLAMCILFFAGANVINLIIVLTITSIPANTRIARASTMVQAEREYVTAAQAQGASTLRILWREIMPNIVLPQLAYTLSFMAIIIMIEGSLSFLGVGVPPPTPTWGGMIAMGFSDINTDPHITFLPALVLFLTVLSLNLIGDRLRRKFDLRSGAL